MGLSTFLAWRKCLLPSRQYLCAQCSNSLFLALFFLSWATETPVQAYRNSLIKIEARRGGEGSNSILPKQRERCSGPGACEILRFSWCTKSDEAVIGEVWALRTDLFRLDDHGLSRRYPDDRPDDSSTLSFSLRDAY
jgi:hypothetical protein